MDLSHSKPMRSMNNGNIFVMSSLPTSDKVDLVKDYVSKGYYQMVLACPLSEFLVPW